MPLAAQPGSGPLIPWVHLLQEALSIAGSHLPAMFTASLSLSDCPMTWVTVILILYLYELCFRKVE